MFVKGLLRFHTSLGEGEGLGLRFRVEGKSILILTLILWPLGTWPGRGTQDSAPHGRQFSGATLLASSEG